MSQTPQSTENPDNGAVAPTQPAPPQKTEEQLLEEKRLLQEEQKRQEEERKRIQEEKRVKMEQDIKKLEEATKGSLSQLAKTPDAKSVAYTRMTLADKQIETLFPLLLRYSNIRHLDLSGNKITDPSVAAQFKHLVQLNLNKNQIVSLQCFSKTDCLGSLQTLQLATNKIVVLTQIGIPNLRRLNLTQNSIKEITWTGHPTLKLLELRKNKLTKLKGLINLPTLKELYIAENQLTDLRGLEGLPNLQRLHVRNNKIKIIKMPFPHLPALIYLNMRQNQLAAIGQILKLPQCINSISFQANPLADQLGENVRKQVIWVAPYFRRINKQEVTVQDRTAFEKELQEKLAEKQRLEREAEEARKLVEEEARKAAEEEARKLAEEEEVKKAAEEEARKLAEEEARKLAQEEQAKKAAEQAPAAPSDSP